MKNFIFAILILAPSTLTVSDLTPSEMPKARDLQSEIMHLAKSNGFTPSERIVSAIIRASKEYSLEPLELTAIGILETGLGKFAKTRKNSNGTLDKGVFQINTVNVEFCIEYNLYSPEGSALCAAKLLAKHKETRKDYLGVYHSKTCRPDFCPKGVYLKKIAKVFENAADKTNNVAINK